MNLIKKNILLIAVAVAVIFGGGFYYLNQNKPEDNKTTTRTTQEKKVVTNVTIKADGQEKNYQVDSVVGKSALEATKLATTEVKMTGEGENAFVTEINGREASSDKKEFWKLVINGKDSEVGAGSYIVKENDKLSWEIDTY